MWLAGGAIGTSPLLRQEHAVIFLNAAHIVCAGAADVRRFIPYQIQSAALIDVGGRGACAGDCCPVRKSAIAAGEVNAWIDRPLRPYMQRRIADVARRHDPRVSNLSLYTQVPGRYGDRLHVVRYALIAAVLRKGGALV